MSTSNPIKDWGAKTAFLRAWFGTNSNKTVVERIVQGFKSTRDHDYHDEIKKYCDNYTSWRRSRPTTKRSEIFWNTLIKDLGLPARINQLYDSSIQEFVQFFSNLNESEYPEDYKTVLNAFLSNRDNGLSATQKDALKRDLVVNPDNGFQGAGSNTEYRIYGNLQATISGSSTGLLSGRIRSDAFYNTPEAAKAWSELVDSDRYTMYLDCLWSLRELVSCQAFRESLDLAGAPTVANLGGGGSPDKDWVMIQAIERLIPAGSSFDYWIIDISPFMFDLSHRQILRNIRRHKLQDRVHVTTFWRDFLELDMGFARPSSSQVIWALLGGTIGNVSERDFFRSLEGPWACKISSVKARS